jgi:hypothetical protein
MKQGHSRMRDVVLWSASGRGRNKRAIGWSADDQAAAAALDRSERSRLLPPSSEGGTLVSERRCLASVKASFDVTLLRASESAPLSTPDKERDTSAAPLAAGCEGVATTSAAAAWGGPNEPATGRSGLKLGLCSHATSAESAWEAARR